MSIDEQVAFLMRDTAACFSGHGETPYEWPQRHSSVVLPKDIFVRVQGNVLGYIQKIMIDESTAHIGHIACDGAYVRRSVTSTILRAFACEVEARYGVVLIVFKERATGYEEKGYPQFFSALGARQLSLTRGQKEGRNDYEWRNKNW
ncbi:hypothetical protein [Herbaspirillum rubrisubalbicans]|nr:hypothetical protein [Herbaspirillum rubrisubalbicans]